MITIFVNGEPREIAADTSVTALLELLSIRAVRVAVEVGGEVVKKADHASRRLNSGDRVEIVAFVGGG